MSRLVMWNLISLDGFFEGAKKWDLDWHQLVVNEEFDALATEQLRSADRLLFGRVTYEGMAAYWPTARGEVADLMNGLPKFVFSRGTLAPKWANTTLANKDSVAEVQRLKREGSRNSLVFGSADLSVTLMAHDLFDEFRLLVTPALLGSGRPLFGQGLPRRRLALLEARRMSSGGVILRYEPVPNP